MAEMSDFKRARVGCVAVVGNKIVATGFSQQRTHPMQDYYNRFRDFRGQKNVCAKLHAECAMLASSQHTSINWAKADVYIYRICKSRPFGNSKPCQSCEKAMKFFGIKNIYHSTDEWFEHLRLA
jgi:deoxycytidylate deaminase